MGKTTLLKHIAARGLPIPEHIDILYVEQEVRSCPSHPLRVGETPLVFYRALQVAGDDANAVESVLAADTVRSGLMGQEADILARMDLPCSLEELEDLSERLNKVYLELRTRGDASAEASARKILAGVVCVVPCF